MQLGNTQDFQNIKNYLFEPNNVLNATDKTMAFNNSTYSSKARESKVPKQQLSSLYSSPLQEPLLQENVQINNKTEQDELENNGTRSPRNKVFSKNMIEIA